MAKIQVFPLRKLSEEITCSDVDFYDESSDSLDRIANEATLELRKYFKVSKSSRGGKQMGKLLFYRLVKGGNVSVVLKVLNNLNVSDPTLGRVVLLGETETKRVTKSQSCFSRFLDFIGPAVVYLFLLLPLNIILTPIFYILHSFTHSIQGLFQISRDIQLPLMFAALSNSSDLLRLFIEYHSDILESTDESGCNVFHYIADISREDHRLASSCFEVLLNVFTPSKTRDVLLNWRNNNGLSGLELAIMIGSPLYFTKVLETEGIFKKTKVIQTADKIYSGRDLELLGDGFLENTKHSAYVLSHYDVSLYERGDTLKAQNFLLSLLTARDFLEMSDEELASIENCTLLKFWIESKLKINNVIIFSTFFINIALWTVLAYYITSTSSADEIDILSYTVYFKAIEGVADAYIQQVNGTKCPNSVVSSEFENISLICKMNDACKYDVQSKLDSTTAPGYKDFVADVALVNILCAAAVMVSDAIFRFSFVAIQLLDRNVHEKLPLSVLVRRTFTRRIQISYVGRQLSLLSACFMMLTTWLRLAVDYVHITGFGTALIKFAFMTLMKLTVVFASLFRVLAIVYFSRLNSAGGHFVISMCKMGKLVLQFVVVYALMASLLSLVFLYVVADPSCPANKIYPFTDTIQSMVGTFRLMLGDNQLPDPMTIEVTITYVVYVILANIMMLSLLTGLAGSVADRVLSRELKDLIMMVERLEDCIDVETTLLFVTYPFRKAVHRWRYSRAMSTHAIVKSGGNNGETFKVLIEVEKLPRSTESK